LGGGQGPKKKLKKNAEKPGRAGGKSEEPGKAQSRDGAGPGPDKEGKGSHKVI